MRLDKMLADAGIGTRSEVKKIISKKQVLVNDKIITNSGFSVTETDKVVCSGREIQIQKNRYYMFHKPAGCVSATTDRDKTVLDYFDENKNRLFPVGRLDKDTEGLLLITDDGAFAHQLMSPKKHVSKTYYFEGTGSLIDGAYEMVKEGFSIGDEDPTLPGELIVESTEGNQVKGRLIIYEGRYHQVKRMMKVLGVTVEYLKRLSIGNLWLDESLAKGEYRMLTEEEMRSLKS